jgi:hypothetical protein
MSFNARVKAYTKWQEAESHFAKIKKNYDKYRSQVSGGHFGSEAAFSEVGEVSV